MLRKLGQRAEVPTRRRNPRSRAQASARRPFWLRPTTGCRDTWRNCSVPPHSDAKSPQTGRSSSSARYIYGKGYDHISEFISSLATWRQAERNSDFVATSNRVCMRSLEHLPSTDVPAFRRQRWCAHRIALWRNVIRGLITEDHLGATLVQILKPALVPESNDPHRDRDAGSWLAWTQTNGCLGAAASSNAPQPDRGHTFTVLAFCEFG